MELLKRCYSIVSSSSFDKRLIGILLKVYLGLKLRNTGFVKYKLNFKVMYKLVSMKGLYSILQIFE